MQDFAGNDSNTARTRFVGTLPGHSVRNWREGCYWKETSMKFLVMGLETSETGYVHLHFYLEMKKSARKAAIIALFERNTWVRPSRARNPSQAITYVRKDGDFVVWGIEPLDVLLGRKRKWTEESEASREECKKRHIFSALSESSSSSNTTRSLIGDYPESQGFVASSLKWTTKPRPNPTKILYLHGKTRVGKSLNTLRACRAAGLTFYRKSSGHKYYGRYLFEDVLIIDEFAGNPITLQHLNSLADPLPENVEEKGGEIPFTSPHIIVLSNRTPEQAYARQAQDHPLEFEAFLSRLHLHEATGWDQVYDLVSGYLARDQLPDPFSALSGPSAPPCTSGQTYSQFASPMDSPPLAEMFSPPLSSWAGSPLEYSMNTPGTVETQSSWGIRPLAPALSPLRSPRVPREATLNWVLEDLMEDFIPLRESTVSNWTQPEASGVWTGEDWAGGRVRKHASRQLRFWGL